MDTGQVEKVLRVAGTTSSTHYVNITVPRMRRRGFQLNLLELAASGTMVKPGEIVARLDTQSLQDTLSNIQANVDNAEMDLAKVRASQALDRSNLRQDLDIVKAQLDQQKLDARAIPVKTPVDQELLQLSLDEAEAAYKQKVAESDLREGILQAEYRSSVLGNETDQRRLEEYKADLDRHTIRATMAGMAVRQEVSRNGELAEVKDGDSLRPGMIFMKIMDLNNMQVDAKVNQTESRLLRAGQKVRIGLDAFPGVTLPGEIMGIGALAQAPTGTSDYVRTIPVTIRIDGTNEKLIPDLSAYGDVILSSAEGVRVPVSAVHVEQGQAYVYVKTADGFEKRPVTTGESNFIQTIITSGLQPGEEVATETPDSTVGAAQM